METKKFGGKENRQQTEQKNLFKIGMQEWGNYRFFICDDETKDEAKKLLIERDYLLRSGKPNQGAIKENAEFFAGLLVGRLVNTRRIRKYGLTNIAINFEKLITAGDYITMYFYLSNLYGTVNWRAPYNFQRLPVCIDALNLYLIKFADAFISQVNTLNEEKANREAEEEKLYDEG